MDTLRQDIRFAVRTIIANRAFSIAVALTMALAIAANTAVFSVAYGVLLRPLPLRDADAIVRLWSRNAERGLDFFSVSPADFAEWREQNRVFSQMGAFERQRIAAAHSSRTTLAPARRPSRSSATRSGRPCSAPTAPSSGVTSRSTGDA